MSLCLYFKKLAGVGGWVEIIIMPKPNQLSKRLYYVYADL